MCDVFPVVSNCLKKLGFVSIIQVVRIFNNLVFCFNKCLNSIIFSIVTQNWQIRFISIFFYVDICTLKENVLSLVIEITNLLTPLKLWDIIDSYTFLKHSWIHPNINPGSDVPTICTTTKLCNRTYIHLLSNQIPMQSLRYM